MGADDCQRDGSELTSVSPCQSRNADCGRRRPLVTVVLYCPRVKQRGNAMPMPAETDTTSPKYLRDKYAIVGVGETTYTRGSGVTTRALGTWAVRNAIEDAGLKASDIDGMLSYQSGDSTFSTFIAGDLGLRLNFYMDVFGGGSSTEALDRKSTRLNSSHGS